MIKSKKFLSAFLALVMVFSLYSTSIFGVTENPGNNADTVGGDFSSPVTLNGTCEQ